MRFESLAWEEAKKIETEERESKKGSPFPTIGSNSRIFYLFPKVEIIPLRIKKMEVDRESYATNKALEARWEESSTDFQ